VIAYLDASALVKVFLDEVGSAEVREIWESELVVSTSELAQTELACAVAAAIRHRRLRPARLDPAILDGTALWRRAEAVAVDASLVRSASSLGVRHALRALDAIHVASALVLVEAAPTLVSWDHDQRRAARGEGLSVYPEGNTAALR
jgi:predicted nucleic acid-binding protein